MAGLSSALLGDFHAWRGVRSPSPPPPPPCMCVSGVPVDVLVDVPVVSAAVDVVAVAVVVVMVDEVECAMSFALFTQFWKSKPLHAMATIK
jgi:hypothetical protein